ncbi:MAG: hypothetical protein WC761_00240 [Candidatus Paceibacterota bacterium]|jgi:hypothetical protein
MAGFKIGQLIYTNSSNAFLWPVSSNAGGRTIDKDAPLLLLGIKRKRWLDVCKEWQRALYYLVIWDEKTWLIDISWIKTKHPRAPRTWIRRIGQKRSVPGKLGGSTLLPEISLKIY